MAQENGNLQLRRREKSKNSYPGTRIGLTVNDTQYQDVPEQACVKSLRRTFHKGVK
jgi:hypothetical protein